MAQAMKGVTKAMMTMNKQVGSYVTVGTGQKFLFVITFISDTVIDH